jgi:hypothetical protein
MQIYADGIKADALRPAQLAIDRFRIKGILLPELNLVYRCTGSKIAAYQPACLLGPGLRLLGRPARSGLKLFGTTTEC